MCAGVSLPFATPVFPARGLKAEYLHGSSPARLCLSGTDMSRAQDPAWLRHTTLHQLASTIAFRGRRYDLNPDQRSRNFVQRVFELTGEVVPLPVYYAHWWRQVEAGEQPSRRLTGQVVGTAGRAPAGAAAQLRPPTQGTPLPAQLRTPLAPLLAPRPRAPGAPPPARAKAVAQLRQAQAARAPPVPPPVHGPQPPRTPPRHVRSRSPPEPGAPRLARVRMANLGAHPKLLFGRVPEVHVLMGGLPPEEVEWQIELWNRDIANNYGGWAARTRLRARLRQAHRMRARRELETPDTPTAGAPEDG